MKKQIGAALAMCAWAACAQAQGNVTVYGVVDAAATIGSGGGAAANEKRLDSGVGPGSRLGFRGNEDLGDGLRALFVLEMGIDSGTGTLQQGGLAWGRQAYVGVGGKDWTVTAGRHYSPNLTAAYVSDALSQVYWGSTSGFGLGIQGSGAAVGSGCHGATSRINNSILGTYKAGALTGRLLVGAGDETSSGTGRFVNPSLTYSEGPLVLAAAYGRLRQCAADIPAGASPAWQTDATAGGSYDFKVVKIAGGYYLWDPSESNKMTLPPKNVSLAEWFNSSKENGNDEDDEGALHA